MSDRYTRRHAQSALERLAHAVGLPVSTDYAVPGLRLDYIAEYGGYQIELVRVQSAIDGNGRPYTAERISQPFGIGRMNAREVVERVRFVTDALFLIQNPDDNRPA